MMTICSLLGGAQSGDARRLEKRGEMEKRACLNAELEFCASARARDIRLNDHIEPRAKLAATS